MTRAVCHIYCLPRLRSFRKFDVNKDAKISREEFAFIMVRRAAQTPVAVLCSSRISALW
jgi:hypothetical protein